MSKRFAVCPTCGAVSMVGGPCEYCGTPIVEKEGTETYGERIVSERTISPMAFAQKISVFKEVGEYICNCAVVNMGKLSGIINLNGDLIFPLEYGQIKIYPSNGIAYLQKGSDSFLFDLVHWKRMFSLPWPPEKVERRLCFEDKDHDDYYYYYMAVVRSSSVYALYDKDDNEIATGEYFKNVKGGIIITRRKYFDFRTRKVYELPPSNSSCRFTVEDGVLYISYNSLFFKVSEGDLSSKKDCIPLNLEGKTAEEIQKEIAETICKIDTNNSDARKEGEKKSKITRNVVTWVGIVSVVGLVIMFFVVLTI